MFGFLKRIFKKKTRNKLVVRRMNMSQVASAIMDDLENYECWTFKWQWDRNGDYIGKHYTSKRKFPWQNNYIISFNTSYQNSFYLEGMEKYPFTDYERRTLHAAAKDFLNKSYEREKRNTKKEHVNLAKKVFPQCFGN